MARSKYTEVEREIINGIAKNLKKYLELRGFNQTELSEKTGLSTSAISDYVNGRTMCSPGNLQKMADALGVQKSDIDSSSFKKAKNNVVPVIGTICAGDGMLAQQHIEDYVYYPIRDQQPDFALKVKGDSMIGAGIESGDIVFLRYAQWADYNGQIVAVLINNDEEGTLKRIKWSEESPLIQLIPENKNYKTIEILPSQIRVCGAYMGHFKQEVNIKTAKENSSKYDPMIRVVKS